MMAEIESLKKEVESLKKMLDSPKEYKALKLSDYYKYSKTFDPKKYNDLLKHEEKQENLYWKNKDRNIKVFE